MYLKSIKIENFRKYGIEDNLVLLSGTSLKDSKNPLSSTLIMGQNNAGKTSIVTALKKSTQSNEKMNVNDFNFAFLSNLIEYYFNNQDEIIDVFINNTEVDESRRNELLQSLLPYIKFSFEIVIDSVNEDSDELITFIAPLIKNEMNDDGIVNLYAKYEINEESIYIHDFCAFMRGKNKDDFKLSDFLTFLSSIDLFSYNCYIDEKCTEKIKFNIDDVIKINQVSYSTLHSESRLSKAFNKIYKYKIKNDETFKDEVEKRVKKINTDLDENNMLKDQLVGTVNKVFEKTVDRQKATMDLHSSITVDTLLGNAVKYVYKVDDYDIPEDQFGMGYTSLMLIIAELIEYVENSPASEFKNKINILLIEEPECYMHPQLQTLFIKNINDAVNDILSNRPQKINCQIVITTHSPYIVKGKLDVENTFNNINYISSTNNGFGKIIPLNDKDIKPENEDDFTFLKKHIRMNSCELFFADACIAVEGYAEEIIVPFYLSKDEDLYKKYISVFSINGAHSHIYEKLFNKLDIPILIITDLDVKKIKDGKEKIENGEENYEQITNLNSTETTNSSLETYGIQYGVIFRNQLNNIYITTQDKIGKYYPTSFEEAFFLTNYNNDILHNALKKVKPKIYQKEIDDKKENLFNKSHLFQKKLAGSKGNFATELLYKMVSSKDEIPTLPQYIQDGFDFLKQKLIKSKEEMQ